MACWTPFPVRRYPSQVFKELLFTYCLITYVQTFISNMDPGGLINVDPNILSFVISSDWENSDTSNWSQYGWFFNLALVLLPDYWTPGFNPTWYIVCEIISGVGSKYLIISSLYPTLNNTWITCLSWSK